MKQLIFIALAWVPSLAFSGDGIYMGQYKRDSVNYYYEKPAPAYDVNPPSLYDSGGNYRGKLSENKYDPDSISNPYGRYGSQYSPDSINNPYGAGSRYNYDSPNNPYGSGWSVYDK